MSHTEQLLAQLAKFDDPGGTVEITPPPVEEGDWRVSCGFVSATGIDLHEALNGAIEEFKERETTEKPEATPKRKKR